MEIVVALLPLLVPILKAFIESGALSRLFEQLFTPETPKEHATRVLDESIAEGDLLTLGEINSRILDSQGDDKLTKEELGDLTLLGDL